MWILTSFGFYSIVQKKGEAVLTVRARVAADLDLLRERYLPDLSKTRTTPGTDYPFRATVSHAQFSAGLARMAADIHYCDFKEALYEEQGQTRGNILMEVWSVLHKLEGENQPAKRSTTFGRHLAFGAVVINCEGKVLLREPFNHRGGHAWTFPKDQPRKNETPEETALRAAAQKAGVHARIIDQIPGVFTGDTTSSGYFLMMYESDNGHEGMSSKSTLWAARAEAEARIKMSSSVMGRARDLEVLSNAYSLYNQRYRQGALSSEEIDGIEGRILTCAALRFDGYQYIDRTGFGCGPALERYLEQDELPASPLDQLCLFFALQRRLMKWDAHKPKTSREWQAFRQLFIITSGYCIPPEYRHAEYCDRWRSEFLSKINECAALVQVIHQGTVYESPRLPESHG